MLLRADAFASKATTTIDFEAIARTQSTCPRS